MNKHLETLKNEYFEKFGEFIPNLVMANLDMEFLIPLIEKALEREHPLSLDEIDEEFEKHNIPLDIE